MNDIEERKERMLAMKLSGKTNVYIGNNFGITGERVAQIIGRLGHVDRKIEILCPTCKEVFKAHKSERRKYCCRKCSSISKQLRPDKAISEYNQVELQGLYRVRNEKKKEKTKLYNQRPEVRKRNKAYQKTEIYRSYQRNYYHRKKKINHE